MFSYRPESVYLKRTFTSLVRYAFRRTAPGNARGNVAWRVNHAPGGRRRIKRPAGAGASSSTETPGFTRGYNPSPHPRRWVGARRKMINFLRYEGLSLGPERTRAGL